MDLSTVAILATILYASWRGGQPVIARIEQKKRANR